MSERKRRVYTAEFKREAVERLIAGETIDVVAAELGVSKTHLYKWRGLLRHGGPLRRAGRPSKRAGALEVEPVPAEALRDIKAARRRIVELERKVGQQQLELDFFRQALRHVGGARQPSDGHGVPRSSRSSRR